jgi:hypothetical protein
LNGQSNHGNPALQFYTLGIGAPLTMKKGPPAPSRQALLATRLENQAGAFHRFNLRANDQ